MMVIRFAVLAVLGAVAWLLVRSLIGRGKTAGRGRTAGGSGKMQQDSKVQDVLVEDPVCHTLVPKNQAIRLRQDGTTYYFCSEACCDKFVGKERGEQ
ncbi:MAG: YHS domain-containing protein [Desulfobulbus sp.]|nr:MAG: YHS domain-containing protein [Desulfobulbus sp.]